MLGSRYLRSSSVLFPTVILPPFRRASGSVRSEDDEPKAKEERKRAEDMRRDETEPTRYHRSLLTTPLAPAGPVGDRGAEPGEWGCEVTRRCAER